MKYSAVWIAKNEADNIGRSIDSLKNAVDEMVVVDTGSTDDTAKIAEAHGARVAHFEWVNDFAAARNYALEQVDGDFVFILDADEWFEPSLTRGIHKEIEKRLVGSSATALMLEMDNVDLDLGIEMGTISSMRVIKGKGALRYTGAAHEYLVATNGKMMTTYELPGARLKHSGYNQRQQQEKILRNVGILEASLEADLDDKERMLTHMYLVRECIIAGRAKDAFAHLQYMLDHPKLTAEQMDRFRDMGPQICYMGVQLAASRRKEISRAQLQTALVQPVSRLYKESSAGKALPVYTDLYFDHNEDVMLEKLDDQLAKADSLLDKTVRGRENYLRAKVELYTAAGIACWRRGQRERAFQYATNALQQTESLHQAETMALLLRCIKGLPLSDVAAFLDTILDTKKRGMQENMVGSLRYEGFKDLYAYYMKKMLDAGRVKKADLWYMMIVLGNYEEAANAAWEAREDTGLKEVQLTIFLACVCGGGEPLYAKFRGQLGNYDPPLIFYFYQRVPPEFNFGVLVNTYQYIAFAADRRTANNFARVFTGFEETMFNRQAEYYMEAGLYRELLREALYEPKDTNSRELRLLAECHLMVGEHQAALDLLVRDMQNNRPTFDLFNLLSVVAEVAEDDDVAADAAALRDHYFPVFEKWVDWQDVVNTGYVNESDNKKQRRELSQMTMEQFEAFVGNTAMEPMAGTVETIYSAANIYEENKSYYAAVDAYRWLFVLGEEQGPLYRKLAGIFLAAGNAALAKQMAEQADG